MNWAIQSKLLPLCLADHLFCVVCDALAQAEAETGLSPVEIWSEALNVSARLAQTPRPDMAFRLQRGLLARRYASLRAPENARCAVLTVLLYMLAAAPGRVDDHPQKSLCVLVAREVMGMPLHGILLAAIGQTELQEEKAGRFVVPKEYLNASKAWKAEEQQEAKSDWIDMAGLVDETLETYSASVGEAVLSVLSAYNDHHDHCIQPHVDRLRNSLRERNRQSSEARRIEVGSGATYNETVNQQSIQQLIPQLTKGQA